MQVGFVSVPPLFMYPLLHVHAVLAEFGAEFVGHVVHVLLSELDTLFELHAVQTGAAAVPVFL